MTHLVPPGDSGIGALDGGARRRRRARLWVTAAAVVSVALTGAAVVVASSNDPDRPADAGSVASHDWSVSHAVVYKVSGRTAWADVTWSVDGGAGVGDAENATLPWSTGVEFPAGQGTRVATLVVGGHDAVVFGEIHIDGVKIAEGQQEPGKGPLTLSVDLRR